MDDIDAPAGIAIRVAAAADIPVLASVQLDSALAGFAHIFPESIPKPLQSDLESEWAAIVGNPTRTALVAVRSGTVVAVAAVAADPEAVQDRAGWLLKLYVLPEHAGHGIGSVLYDAAVGYLAARGCRSLRLWVLEENTRARSMYERRGWQLLPARRTDWPGTGIDEVGYSLRME